MKKIIIAVAALLTATAQVKCSDSGQDFDGISGAGLSGMASVEIPLPKDAEPVKTASQGGSAEFYLLAAENSYFYTAQDAALQEGRAVEERFRAAGYGIRGSSAQRIDMTAFTRWIYKFEYFMPGPGLFSKSLEFVKYIDANASHYFSEAALRKDMVAVEGALKSAGFVLVRIAMEQANTGEHSPAWVGHIEYVVPAGEKPTKPEDTFLLGENPDLGYYYGPAGKQHIEAEGRAEMERLRAAGKIILESCAASRTIDGPGSWYYKISWINRVN